jgi:microtubule-associated protein-like 6
MVTGDDFGYLKLFNFPCVAKDAPCIVGRGHSSHVMNAKFVSDLSLATAGGNDCSVMLWKIERNINRGGPIMNNE